jgi:hypothetical protein
MRRPRLLWPLAFENHYSYSVVQVSHPVTLVLSGVVAGSQGELSQERQNGHAWE